MVKALELEVGVKIPLEQRSDVVQDANNKS